VADQGGNIAEALGPIPGLNRRRFSLRIGSGPTVGDALGGLGAWWRRKTADPVAGAAFKKRFFGFGGAAALAIGLGLYFWLRPVPQPDYATDGLDEVFDYTLLTDEFNNLPVEERLKLMGQLVQRLRSMSAGDSVLLGAFAAGIAGSARDQIEKNMSRLAIDVWDKHALQYQDVPAEGRAEYLESTFVEFTKMMEAVAGEPREISDEERLAEVRRDIARDRERLSQPDRQPRGEELGRFFGFMNNNVGGNATAQQRTRGQQMLRDMMRHFRGQDIATGKPMPGGG
jgi:hypothetical protein